MGTQVNMGNQQVVGPQFGGSTIAGARASGTQGFNAPTESQSSEPLRRTMATTQGDLEATAPITVEAKTSTFSDLLESAISRTDSLQRERWGRIRAIAASAAASKIFPDCTTESNATMRILAGEALGLHEFVAMKEIKFIMGNLTMSYTLIGSLIRRAGYQWGYQRHDENGCVLVFYRGHDETGNLKPMIDPATGQQVTVSWTREDAERAGLTGPRGEGKTKGNYDKYPKNLYLAGCLRNFPRFHAPEVMNGVTVYTPDEVDEIVTQSAPGQMPRRAESITGESPATGTEKRNDA